MTEDGEPEVIDNPEDWENRKMWMDKEENVPTPVAQPETKSHWLQNNPWQHDMYLREAATREMPKGQIQVEGKWLTLYDVYPTNRSELAHTQPRGFVKGLHCHTWRFKGTCSNKEKCGYIHAIAEKGRLAPYSSRNDRDIPRRDRDRDRDRDRERDRDWERYDRYDSVRPRVISRSRKRSHHEVLAPHPLNRRAHRVMRAHLSEEEEEFYQPRPLPPPPPPQVQVSDSDETDSEAFSTTSGTYTTSSYASDAPPTKKRILSSTKKTKKKLSSAARKPAGVLGSRSINTKPIDYSALPILQVHVSNPTATKSSTKKHKHKHRHHKKTDEPLLEIPTTKIKKIKEKKSSHKKRAK